MCTTYVTPAAVRRIIGTLPMLLLGCCSDAQDPVTKESGHLRLRLTEAGECMELIMETWTQIRMLVYHSGELNKLS